MKKIFSISLAALASIALFSCTKEITPDVEETIVSDNSFTIIASSVNTKTAVNDGSAVWVANDEINVFHADTGTTDYVNDTYESASNTKKPFVISDAESNAFSGSLTETLDKDTSYDWYTFYPYSSYITTPANTSAGYTTVGSSSSGSQTQTGNNSVTHLAGKYIPLYGVAKSVSANTVPEITMQQAVSVVAIKVKNSTASNLTVSSVSFTGTEDIVGTYYINFADVNNVAFTKSGDNYVSNTANLTVKNGDPIAQEGVATFYIAIKPFTYTSTSENKIKISVNGYEKILDLSKNVSFEAGKIKTISFNYDYVKTIEEPSEKSGLYRVEKSSWINVGDWVVIAANDSNSAISQNQATNNRTGSDIVKGTDGDYKTITNFEGAQLFEIVEGNSESTFGLKSVYGDQNGKYLAATGNTSNILKSVASLSNDSSWLIDVDANGSATITAQGTSTHNIIRYNSTNNLFAAYESSSSGSDIAIYKLYGDKPCGAPVSNVVPGNIASGTSVTLSCSVDGATIYYTTDGSEPTTSSSIYSEPLQITSSCTIKAFATKTGYSKSNISSFEYTVINNAKTYTLTIQTSDFSTSSYAANNGSHDFTAVNAVDSSKTMTVSIYTNQIMQSSSAMQWQAKNAYLYNSTDIGTIESITVNSTAGTFTTYYGTAQNPTENTTVGNGYFTVKVGSATGKTSSVVVVFTIN